MKKSTKIILICVIIAAVVVAVVFITDRIEARETLAAQYAQGIEAGEDTATVEIDIED